MFDCVFVYLSVVVLGGWETVEIIFKGKVFGARSLHTLRRPFES